MRYGVMVPMTTGEFIAADVAPPAASRELAEDLFELASTRIAEQWAIRLKGTEEHRNEWLQKICYQLIGTNIENGHKHVFERRIRLCERRMVSGINLFQRGLLAIFAHDKGLLTEQPRERFGKRLWHAYRHYVPYQFLIGFLREYWKDDADFVVEIDLRIEKDMEDWIFQARASDASPRLRGKYPPHIEEMAEQYLDNLEPISTHLDALKRFRARRKRQLKA